MRSPKHWAAVISVYEGKKHQASVGDIAEILGIIVDLDMKGSTIIADLIAYSDKKYAELIEKESKAKPKVMAKKKKVQKTK